MIKPFSILLRLSVAGIFMATSSVAFALLISDYKPESSNSGSVEISQLDGAGYLDIVVEVSGQIVNYQLQQIHQDLVIVSIDDNQLDADEVFIRVSVQSPTGYTSRLFSHTQSTAEFSGIKTKTEALATREAVKTPTRTKVLVPAANYTTTDEQVDSVDMVDGKLQIDITGGINTVHHALNQLAKANNLNVLILLGDDAVHQAPLISEVTDFNDLYVASDGVVRHVFIDDNRQFVRVVGDDFDTANSDPLTLQQNSTLPLREVLITVARSDNYEPIILIGDETILNTLVDGSLITSIDELALLVGEIGGILDVDDANKLIRVRN